MTTLQNFPLLDQRTTTTSDGQLDINHDWDCVAESIAAAMTWLTGTLFVGGVLKEIIYGTTYQGGTDAAAYAQYVAQHGVRMYALQGDNTTLVQLAHQQIALGHPVLLTEIDPYIDLSLYPGSTHVVCGYGEDPGSVTVMDPFGGYSVTKTDSQWTSMVRSGQIWVLEAIQTEAQMAISLNTPEIDTSFRQAPGGAWQCTESGHEYVIGGAILSYYRTLGNAGLCGLTILGLPTSNEIPPLVNGVRATIKGHEEIVEQIYEHATVRYDPTHFLDKPRGAGPVYLVHQEITSDQVKQALAQVLDLQHKLQTIATIIKA